MTVVSLSATVGAGQVLWCGEAYITMAERDFPSSKTFSMPPAGLLKFVGLKLCPMCENTTSFYDEITFGGIPFESSRTIPNVRMLLYSPGRHIHPI